jgi:hypothetical protein
VFLQSSSVCPVWYDHLITASSDTPTKIMIMYTACGMSDVSQVCALVEGTRGGGIVCSLNLVVVSDFIASAIKVCGLERAD